MAQPRMPPRPKKTLLTPLYLKWITNRSYCIAQRTLLNVMWQPGWEGSLGENGYIYICIYMYMYIYVCMYMYVCIYVCICIYMYTHTYICMYICIYVCICICIYMYICMAESLCCSLETITTLLIVCTPIQNKKFKKIK